MIEFSLMRDQELLQDLRQTKEYGFFLKTQSWQIEKIEDVFVFIKKLPILPISVIKIQRPKKSKLSFDFSRIDQIAKKHNALFVKMEPFGSFNEQTLKKAGFRKDSWLLLAPKTLCFDLRKPEDKLLKEMNKKTRYGLRKAQKSGLEIKIISGKKLKEKQLKDFYKFFKKARKEKKLWRPHLNYLRSLFKSFGKKSYLLQANFSKEIIAAVVLLFSKNMAFYYFSSSNSLGNKLFAPTALVWQAIKLSKKQKKKIFDFEGIYDPRFKVTRPWQGFSHFKKGFGGKEKEFESFIKYYWPLKFF